MNNLSNLLNAIKAKIETDRTEYRNNVHILHGEEQFFTIQNFLLPAAVIIDAGSENEPQTKTNYYVWTHNVDILIYNSVSNIAKTVTGYGSAVGLITLCDNLMDTLKNHKFTGTVDGIISARINTVYGTRPWIEITENGGTVGVKGFRIKYKEYYTE